MNADHELLKLAAKAVGLDYHIDHLDGTPKLVANGYVWNPLVWDGQALRLAGEAEIDIQFHPDAVSVLHWKSDIEFDVRGLSEAFSDHNGDKMAATRRAIVRAVADIGAHT